MYFFALKFDRRYRKDAYIKDLTIEYSLGFEKRCRVWKMDDFVSLEINISNDYLNFQVI